MVAHSRHELEHSAAIVFPNHNTEDRLMVAGVYGPPEKNTAPLCASTRENAAKQQRNKDNPNRYGRSKCSFVGGYRKRSL